MKKILLTILIAVGLAGCGSQVVDPRYVMLANMGCNTLGLQLKNVKVDNPYFSNNDVRIIASCDQRVTLIVEFTPEVEQDVQAPAKQSKPVLKDA